MLPETQQFPRVLLEALNSVNNLLKKHNKEVVLDGDGHTFSLEMYKDGNRLYCYAHLCNLGFHNVLHTLRAMFFAAQ